MRFLKKVEASVLAPTDKKEIETFAKEEQRYEQGKKFKFLHLRDLEKYPRIHKWVLEQLDAIRADKFTMGTIGSLFSMNNDLDVVRWVWGREGEAYYKEILKK